MFVPMGVPRLLGWDGVSNLWDGACGGTRPILLFFEASWWPNVRTNGGKMTVFDRYWDDFEHARQDAFTAIDDYAHSSDPVEREELVVTAKSCVDEVERYIRVLENEAKHGGSKMEQRKRMEQVHHCKTQWTRLKASLEREMLVSDARTGKLATSSMEATSKEQVESCANVVDRTERHLDEAQRTLAHTEEIAENVANNLMRQRNQLEHTELNIAQTQDDTEEAKGHIRSMAFKAFTSQILMILVIVALIVAIALVSYFRWYPRNKKDYLGILPHANSSSAGSVGKA
ncbi:hypothetical protein PsorP6_018055 [Peronosclerospora sorghi]|uniref:Uncharacterized protein n=1 Tax=Peronosclerospora sorghi TaxID=230839 RepID=A0ACC0WF60_9STRA|nr:hypothetical protein PsorP6_018055 [Peronosclerospora sorghi]